MKVILLADVKGLGKKGDAIEASEGHARNYLVPRKLAVAATPENLANVKARERAKAAQAIKEKETALTVSKKLEALIVKVSAKGGEGGRLFGSVTSEQISEALKAQHGIDIEKNKIVQSDPIKGFGSYQLKVKLGHEISGTLHIVVAEAK
ncbi:MAG: 50S ribosomal protein L9 [Oscillospiraceae bacterium]|jgi:large subunit ribosomal protein L9|nr:50S ribosomal protein L9 [Oscillospiraceae bacterium]